LRSTAHPGRRRTAVAAGGRDRDQAALDAVGLLNERRSGRSDRSADFRVLARWFAEAPDDEAAHRLWRAAFGLCPADPELAGSGFTLTLDNRSDRSDLVAVVRMLLGWGVLGRVAGDEDAYLSAGTDVLYDVRRLRCTAG
jgi:uncharacterized protein (TIGR02678 family)